MSGNSSRRRNRSTGPPAGNAQYLSAPPPLGRLRGTNPVLESHRLSWRRGKAVCDPVDLSRAIVRPGESRARIDTLRRAAPQMPPLRRARRRLSVSSEKTFTSEMNGTAEVRRRSEAGTKTESAAFEMADGSGCHSSLDTGALALGSRDGVRRKRPSVRGVPAFPPPWYGRSPVTGVTSTLI